MEGNPTNIEDIELPVKDVKLRNLKTRTGEPVTVRCERISEIRFADIVRSLPGYAPRMGIPAEEDPEEKIRRTLPYSGPLIQETTSLMRADGSVQRPAFWYEAPVDGALPVRYLSDVDRLLILSVVLELSGFFTEATEEVRFRDGDGGGDGSGPGAVRAGGDATATEQPAQPEDEPARSVGG